MQRDIQFDARPLGIVGQDRRDLSDLRLRAAGLVFHHDLDGLARLDPRLGQLRDRAPGAGRLASLQCQHRVADVRESKCMPHGRVALHATKIERLVVDHNLGPRASRRSRRRRPIPTSGGVCANRAQLMPLPSATPRTAATMTTSEGFMRSLSRKSARRGSRSEVDGESIPVSFNFTAGRVKTVNAILAAMPRVHLAFPAGNFRSACGIFSSSASACSAWRSAASRLPTMSRARARSARVAADVGIKLHGSPQLIHGGLAAPLSN